MKKSGPVLLLLILCVVVLGVGGCSDQAIPTTTAATTLRQRHPTAWADLHPTADLPPCARRCLVCDRLTSRVILSGPPGIQRLSQRYLGLRLEPQHLTELRPDQRCDLLPSRWNIPWPTLAPAEVILFGQGESGYLNDIWACDPHNAWTELHPTGDRALRTWVSRWSTTRPAQGDPLRGQGDRGNLNDTWSTTPPPTPGPTSPHGDLPSARLALYGLRRGRGKVVLFGVWRLAPRVLMPHHPQRHLGLRPIANAWTVVRPPATCRLRALVEPWPTTRPAAG